MSKLTRIDRYNLNEAQPGRKGVMDGREVTIDGVEALGVTPYISFTFDDETDSNLTFPGCLYVYEDETPATRPEK